ncbi:hypothetical protein FRACYDRAFT_250782 [Fragilariopsis cylindrus CCMP1102]|uniref:Uncharacterized protein n=1 Tax=Fragilariopsis cylindrus CCMP1102 TaxID=635003 RepID=A0A1E7EPP9_9STRA|nr:hypothetical protein FRACYDRAFT_250782 [Fragilariopsis cylindrus CCMP1102]|eukprot:OEU07756.1 hypothetical protein FRACYDRAFT_250782 [Fragilariopsis cylindrus CCMP1102]
MMKFNTLVITAATVAAAALLSPSASYYVSAQVPPCPTDVSNLETDTSNEFCMCDKSGKLNCDADRGFQCGPVSDPSILKGNDDGDGDFIVYAGIGAVDGVVKTSGGNAATATIALSIVAAVSMIGSTTVDLF